MELLPLTTVYDKLQMTVLYIISIIGRWYVCVCLCVCVCVCINTHKHTHTRWFLWFTGTLHRRNGFYTVQAVCAITLNLPYT